MQATLVGSVHCRCSCRCGCSLSNSLRKIVGQVCRVGPKLLLLLLFLWLVVRATQVRHNKPLLQLLRQSQVPIRLGQLHQPEPFGRCLCCCRHQHCIATVKLSESPCPTCTSASCGVNTCAMAKVHAEQGNSLPVVFVKVAYPQSPKEGQYQGCQQQDVGRNHGHPFHSAICNHP